MKAFFDRQPEIQAEILAIIETYKKSSCIFDLDEAQFEHLKEISTKGKQFRGCLLVSLYETLNGKHIKTAIRLAAAVELYGTALLIHDDIMDRSETRRGLPSTYKHFESQAKQTNLRDAAQFGLSVGISLGDVLFFMAESTIYSLDISTEVVLKLSRLCSHELLHLGLAQVEDMRMSFARGALSQDSILKMYAGKTGRYTGRWPMQLAAVLAGLDDETSEMLGTIGEKIGVLFQIKDDELGVFGDETVMGKSSTSDIKEGKRTLYYQFLETQLQGSSKNTAFSVFGNSSATSEQINGVKQIIIESGVKRQVDQMMIDQKQIILNMIADTNISSESKKLLQSVVKIVADRTK